MSEVGEGGGKAECWKAGGCTNPVYGEFAAMVTAGFSICWWRRCGSGTTSQSRHD